MAGEVQKSIAARNTKNKKSRIGSVQEQLVEGEEIIHVSYVHPGVFIYPGSIMTIAMLVGIFFHWLVGTVIFLMALYPSIDALIRYLTTKLVLTNKRVLARYGFFSKDNIHLKLSRVESAYREEPFVGQILGYSTVVINGTGTGTIPITFIADGGAFVKALESQTLNAA